MHQNEKQAWYTLAVFGAAVSVYIVLAFIIGPKPAFGAFGIFGLSGFAPLIGRKRNDEDVVYDERDLQIQRKAAAGSFALFWVVFVLFSIGFWGYKYHHGVGTIPVDILPMMVFVGMLIIFPVQALIMIIQYRKGAR